MRVVPAEIDAFRSDKVHQTHWSGDHDVVLGTMLAYEIVLAGIGQSEHADPKVFALDEFFQFSVNLLCEFFGRAHNHRTKADLSGRQIKKG